MVCSSGWTIFEGDCCLRFTVGSVGSVGSVVMEFEGGKAII